MPRQELLPDSIARLLPKLYSQEKKGDQAMVRLKLFCPWNSWTWFITEYDPKERIFFGLVKGLETELGYFSLDELLISKGPLGLYIERDEYFTPCTLYECKVGHP